MCVWSWPFRHAELVQMRNNLALTKDREISPRPHPSGAWTARAVWRTHWGVRGLTKAAHIHHLPAGGSSVFQMRNLRSTKCEQPQSSTTWRPSLNIVRATLRNTKNFKNTNKLGTSAEENVWTDSSWQESYWNSNTLYKHSGQENIHWDGTQQQMITLGSTSENHEQEAETAVCTNGQSRTSLEKIKFSALFIKLPVTQATGSQFRVNPESSQTIYYFLL